MFEKVLFTDEMKRLDQYTCEEKKLSSLELMEIAGKNVYEYFIENCQVDKIKDNILIVSGLGNNGGDALVVSEHLIKDNYKVNIVVIGDLKHLTNESFTVYQRLLNNKVSILNVNNNEDLKIFNQYVNEATIIIDGIFGIGLSREVKGIFYECIRLINQSHAFILSIDIPSGIYGDNGIVAKIAIEADHTVIIQNYKVGNLLNDAKDYHGKVKLLDIGILQDINDSNRFLLNDEIMNIIKKRRANTHKYHYGNLLTIGGSKGMTGAPLLSAYSALRIGVGLSSIVINSKDYEFISQIYPEIMIKPYSNIDELKKILVKANIIAFGPGLGRENKINYDILKYLLDTNIPIVIDADGIYYLKEILDYIGNRDNIIITPHLGEMALLLDTDTKTITENWIVALNYLTNNYGLNVVLKGPCTIIANKENMYFCNKGNSGMATAGSGDVLTGIISGLVGQGLKPIDACNLGVYIHAKAGDMAYKEYGNSLIATDITNNIHKVIRW